MKMTKIRNTDNTEGWRGCGTTIAGGNAKGHGYFRRQFGRCL